MINFTWIPFCVIALDQMTKRVAVAWSEKFMIWTSFLEGRATWNKGISFGLLSASYYNLLVYSLVWLGLGLVFFAWIRAKNKLDSLGWGLVVGGGISNLWDRWVFGAVLDFIYFHFNEWHFPIFNVADIAISIGALVLLRGFFWQSKGKKIRKKSEEE